MKNPVGLLSCKRDGFGAIGDEKFAPIHQCERIVFAFVLHAQQLEAVIEQLCDEVLQADDAMASWPYIVARGTTPNVGTPSVTRSASSPSERSFSERQDLNLRPLGPQPSALPN